MLPILPMLPTLPILITLSHALASLSTFLINGLGLPDHFEAAEFA
jgi:hypothetical protein